MVRVVVTNRPLLIRITAYAACATAAVAIVVLLTGHPGPTSWRVLATTTAISVFGLLGVPVVALLERGRAVTFARISRALTLATFVVTLAVTWTRGTSELWKTWGVLLTLTVAAAQACAVEARRRDNDTQTVAALASGSMATGGVLAAMGVAAILSDVPSAGYYRLLGAVAVLDVLLVVLAAVLRRDTGGINQTHRMRLDGRLVEVAARDFGGAVAIAIRQAEKEGGPVKRIERA